MTGRREERREIRVDVYNTHEQVEFAHSATLTYLYMSITYNLAPLGAVSGRANISVFRGALKL